MIIYMYIYVYICDRGAGGPSLFKFSEVGDRVQSMGIPNLVCEHVHCHIFTNPLVD